MLEAATMTIGKYQCTDESIIEITELGIGICCIDNMWHCIRDILPRLVKKL